MDTTMTDQMQDVELVEAESLVVDEPAPIGVALKKLEDLKEQIKAIPNDDEYEAAAATIATVEQQLVQHAEQAYEFFEMLSQDRENIFMELAELQSAVANWDDTGHSQVRELVNEVTEAVSGELQNDAIGKSKDLIKQKIQEDIIEGIQYWTNCTYTEAHALMDLIVNRWARGLKESEYELFQLWGSEMAR